MKNRSSSNQRTKEEKTFTFGRGTCDYEDLNHHPGVGTHRVGSAIERGSEKGGLLDEESTYHPGIGQALATVTDQRPLFIVPVNPAKIKRSMVR